MLYMKPTTIFADKSTMIRLSSFIILLFLTQSIVAQREAELFAPLDIPLYLAGNFGELRSNHFHSGLDFKTQGREGLNVYSSDTGYVSRIKISPYGYGKALYISHPNGLTTVYAHLKEYNADITKFLKEAQYELESFVVDLYPGKGQLPVGRGEKIGLSGNTGSSGGPHLHYEIRDTKTERPLNPLVFGFEIKDLVKPEIFNLMVLPLDGGKVEGDSKKKTFKTAQTRGRCALDKSTAIQIEGKFGMALHTIDRLSDQPNKCGVYSIELYIDSVLSYSQKMDELDFEAKKHMNAHTVYDVYRRDKNSFHRSFILPNNKLPIYRQAKSEFDLAPGLHGCEYVVKDLNGNTSLLSFSVNIANGNSKVGGKTRAETGELFKYDEINTFRTIDCSVYMALGRLFDDMTFNYAVLDTLADAISPTFQLGDSSVPLANKMILKIKAPEVDSTLVQKVLITRYDPTRKRTYNVGGRMRNGWMETHTGFFGQYCLMIDSVAPRVKVNSFSKTMSSRKSFSFVLTDDLSGIEKYDVFIDGRWVLAEFDGKRAVLKVKLADARIARGSHDVIVRVSDERKNISEWSSTFIW